MTATYCTATDLFCETPHHDDDSCGPEALPPSPTGHAPTTAATEDGVRGQLAAAEQLFATLLNSFDGDVAIFDHEWHFLHVNQQAVDRLGVPREQLVGRCIWEIFPEAIGTTFYQEAHQAVTEQAVTTFEHFYPARGRWFENRICPFAGGAILFGTDITERKQALAAQEQAAQRLRESERKFAAVFHASPLVITITRLADGRFVEVNETFVRTTGYSRAETIGYTPLEMNLWIAPERREEALLRVRAGDSLRNREDRFRMKDGRIVTCLSSVETLEINGEKCVVTVLTDITERKQAEEALQELNSLLEQRIEERTADLERSNEELDQFAYVASHDLKAPLRSIALLAEWIQEDAGDTLSAAAKQNFQRLQQRVQRLDNLLRDLLAYSRAGRQRHKPERVESAALVRQIVELLDIPPTFALIVEEPMPVLETEQLALDMALRNLIGNAYKHHHQPEQGHVWVAAEAREGWVEFSVRDDGPGIDPRYHERIFGVFQTLRPRDEVEGSGIGLALAKRVVEMRGGTIRVESTPGHGATFTFTWPMQVEQAAKE